MTEADQYCSIKSLPKSMRPRERLQKGSAAMLTDYELVAILLGSGVKGLNVLDVAQSVLQKANGVKGLPDLTLEELSGIRGLGPARATVIKAAGELARRIQLEREHPEPEQITGSVDASRIAFNRLRYEKQEVFVVIFLNTKNRIIAVEEVFQGTLNTSLVHPRDIFRLAVRHNAHAIICAHNHPGNDPTPSRADHTVTQRLADAGELMGIAMLDHIIVTAYPHIYYSFKDNNMM